MQIDSAKKAMTYGIVCGVLQIVLMTIFIAVVFYLTDGEDFFFKEGVKPEIGGISLKKVDSIGYIIASIIPMLLLRYKSIIYLPLNILASCLSYLFSFFIFDYILYYIFSCNLLGSLGVIHYSVWVFPMGAVIGTIISIILNTIINLNNKRSTCI